jgi:phosphohistidine phosphatase
MLVPNHLEIDAGNGHNNKAGLQRDRLMLRLLLLRHAKAERSRPGERDQDRPLAERGRRDAPAIGVYLASHDLVPDAAVVSPAARTRETWDLLAKAIGHPPQPTWDGRLYDASADGILAAIRDTGPATGTLLVIGHNPGLHDIANRLVGSGERDARMRLAEGLPTCGLAAIEFAAKSWSRIGPQTGRLTRFVTPKSLTVA